MIKGDAKFLKIQTCVLKVNVHCDGCKNKVKKLLHKIEGVYTVNIDLDQQKVTVSGCVDPNDLINKLIKSGKHAELWPSKGNKLQNHEQEEQRHQHSCGKNAREEKGTKEEKRDFPNKGPKSHQKKPPLIVEDSGEESDDELDEGPLGILREKARRTELQKRHNEVGNNKNKRGNKHAPNAANPPGKKTGNFQGKDGKKQNQNMGFKEDGGDQQKNLNKVGGSVNNKVKGTRRGIFGSNVEDHGMDGVGVGYQGLGGGGDGGTAGGFGTNLPGNGGFQGRGYTDMGVAGYYGGGLNGFNDGMHQYQQQHPIATMNNNHNRQMGERYTQMMYNRTPAATTAVYHHQPHPQYESAAHLFSDENAHGCVIM